MTKFAFVLIVICTLCMANWVYSDTVKKNLTFDSYDELIKHYGEVNVPLDGIDIWNIATFSNVTPLYVSPDSGSIITAFYLDGRIFGTSIRGAQGNGLTGILKQDSGQIISLATIYGNQFTSSVEDNQLLISTHSHWSAMESIMSRRIVPLDEEFIKYRKKYLDGSTKSKMLQIRKAQLIKVAKDLEIKVPMDLQKEIHEPGLKTKTLDKLSRIISSDKSGSEDSLQKTIIEVQNKKDFTGAIGSNRSLQIASARLDFPYTANTYKGPNKTDFEFAGLENFEISGSTENRVIVSSAYNISTIFSFKNCNNITLKNLEFSIEAGTGNTALSFQDCDNIQIENCSFIMGNDIELGNTNNMSIIRCDFLQENNSYLISRKREYSNVKMFDCYAAFFSGKEKKEIFDSRGITYELSACRFLGNIDIDDSSISTDNCHIEMFDVAQADEPKTDEKFSPVKFDSLKECFEFIAKPFFEKSDIPKDENKLLKLAVETRVDLEYPCDDDAPVYLFKPRYFVEGKDLYAQKMGSDECYGVLMLEDGFKFVSHVFGK